MYAAATHLQILKPKEYKRWSFLKNIQSAQCGKIETLAPSFNPLA